jgi:hypothetical protein
VSSVPGLLTGWQRFTVDDDVEEENDNSQEGQEVKHCNELIETRKRSLAKSD